MTSQLGKIDLNKLKAAAEAKAAKKKSDEAQVYEVNDDETKKDQ